MLFESEERRCRHTMSAIRPNQFDTIRQVIAPVFAAKNQEVVGKLQTLATTNDSLRDDLGQAFEQKKTGRKTAFQNEYTNAVLA